MVPPQCVLGLKGDRAERSRGQISNIFLVVYYRCLLVGLGGRGESCVLIIEGGGYRHGERLFCNRVRFYVQSQSSGNTNCSCDLHFRGLERVEIP